MSRVMSARLKMATGLVLWFASSAASSQTTEAQVAAAKLENELQVLRKSIAEAERDELLAKLPATESKAPAGTINSENFGAAANVRAFDLAQQLARDVCPNLSTPVSIYNPTIVSGVVSARALIRNIDFLDTQIKTQTSSLRSLLEEPDRRDRMAPLIALGAVTSGIKAVADLASLFKSDIVVASKPYGEDTRELFISALGEACREKIKGLGSGYLGDFNSAWYETIDQKVRALIVARSELETALGETQTKAEKSRGVAKQRMTAASAAASQLLRAVDAYIVSLKIGDPTEQSPIYSAARYLTYDERTAGLPILDFKLNLEGLAITKTNMFTGQHLRLSGVAFLWYRVQQPNGTLILSRTLRKLSSPIEINLRGTDAPDNFFDADPRVPRAE